MKSLPAKFALHKAIGVFLGEHEVSVSKVAVTPLGPVETASASEPYSPDILGDVLQRLLEPLLGRKRRVPVAVGLPGTKLFFNTRPVSPGSVPTPESLLQKTLCSTTINIDDLASDMLVGNVHKKPVASIVACRKKYMSGVVAALEQLGARLVRAEPSPCAIVRTAVARKKYPRRGKAVLCVFLGEVQGLAAVVVGDRPLAWKTFALPAGGEGAAILSAARTLQTQEKNYGIESAFDYVVVHGRADLHERLLEERLPTQLEIRVVWQTGPALDGPTMARGLALGCVTQNTRGFDLAHSLKARAAIWEIFPWWDLAFTSLLVVLLGVVLLGHSMGLDESYTALQARCSNHKFYQSADTKKLAEKTESLEKKVNAVERFLAGRCPWTEYASDIASRLPRNAVLNSFSGQWTLESGRGKGGMSKKSLSLTARVPMESSDSTPREIDDFLDSLRNDPLLQRGFGSVKLTDIKRTSSRDRKTSTAVFTVVCQPDAKGVAKPPAGDAKGKK